ncbi:MAG: hypothetical protein ACP5HS_13835 [Anaerolineae bacterium]
MGTARDIALIFLSLQGLVIALVPLALISGLAYGIYRLHKWTRYALRQAQVYVQQAHDAVEKGSRAVAEPFYRTYAAGQAVTTVFGTLTRRLRKDG